MCVQTSALILPMCSLADVVVVHHVSYAGTRYHVDRSVRKKLKPLERDGHAKIVEYAEKMG